MKIKFYFLVMLLVTSAGLNAQFTPQTIDYPDTPGIRYYPYLMSVLDESHAWIGSEAYELPALRDSSFTIVYKTENGGNSWEQVPVPAGDSNYTVSVSAAGVNTVYCAFYNYNTAKSSIWKTTDGGTSWQSKLTDQFTGGYIDFCHAFSPDTLVAMGDPNGGAFEIYTSTDGGDSWTKVPAENMPAPLTNEFGFTTCYGALGHTIWFTTNKGRCIRSNDYGQTWRLLYDSPPPNGWYYVAFSTEQIGVIYNANDPFASNTIAVTSDGGNNWIPISFDSTHYISHVAAIPGLDSAFILTVYDTTFTKISVWFTPDLFKNIEELVPDIYEAPWSGTPAPGSLFFLNPSTGWLCGNGSEPGYLFKFSEVLTSVSEKPKSAQELLLYPNPSSACSTLEIPLNNSDIELFIKIFDLTGRLFLSQAIDPGMKTITLDASKFDGGIYLVELISADKVVASRKWIVQH